MMRMRWGILGVLLAGALAALPGGAAEPSIDLEWVKRTIEEKQVSSIEELLPLLPREYRDFYVLMYESRSTQKATPENPRVILFGPDASLLMAFNGDPSHVGHDRIEAIQFNRAEARFEFHEIARDAGTGRLAVTPGANCASCHRPDPRPNWQPYAHWPGAYGSNDDRLEGRRTSVGERANLARFRKAAASHPRYRHLVGLGSHFGEQTGDFGRMPGKRNQRLTNHLAPLNFLRIARLAMESRDYEKYRYALLGSLCVGFVEELLAIERFYPSSMRPPAYWVRTGESQSLWASAFIYALEHRGIPWEDWTTLTKGVTSDIFDKNPFVSGGSYGTDLLAYLVERDPALQSLATVSENDWYEEYGLAQKTVRIKDCEELARLSRRALGGE